MSASQDDTEGLREQLAKALWARVTAAVLPETRPLPDGTIGHFVGVTQYDLADTALAVLVEPPGDLREQMADALVAADAEWTTCREAEWKDFLAAAAVSVRWEDAARRIAAAEARADEAERELSEAKHALYIRRITHARETHPDRIVAGDCEVCRVFVEIDHDMPSRPDDPEEIRRLAQATTEETRD